MIAQIGFIPRSSAAAGFFIDGYVVKPKLAADAIPLTAECAVLPGRTCDCTSSISGILPPVRDRRWSGFA